MPRARKEIVGGGGFFARRLGPLLMELFHSNREVEKIALVRSKSQVELVLQEEQI
jgi:hypothetical protein